MPKINFPVNICLDIKSKAQEVNNEISSRHLSIKEHRIFNRNRHSHDIHNGCLEKRNVTVPKEKKSPTLWRNSNGELGLIFTKKDLPVIMKKRERLQHIIDKNIERKRQLINKRYTLYHPIVKLFESNLRKISNNEILMNSENFNLLKRLDDEQVRLPNHLQHDLLKFKDILSIKNK